MVRRARAEASTLDTGHKLPHSLQSVKTKIKIEKPDNKKKNNEKSITRHKRSALLHAANPCNPLCLELRERSISQRHTFPLISSLSPSSKARNK